MRLSALLVSPLPLPRSCALLRLTWLECTAVNVTVAGVRYGLYTHVHHHYGLNDAFDRSVELMLMRAPSRQLLQVQ